MNLLNEREEHIWDLVYANSFLLYQDSLAVDGSVYAIRTADNAVKAFRSHQQVGSVSCKDHACFACVSERDLLSDKWNDEMAPCFSCMHNPIDRTSDDIDGIEMRCNFTLRPR